MNIVEYRRLCTEYPSLRSFFPVLEALHDNIVIVGKDGVIQGVKDSSGDDVTFRWLVLENEDAGHPLQLLSGHEVVVDGALPTDRSLALPTSILMHMWNSGMQPRPVIGDASPRSKTIWRAS